MSPAFVAVLFSSWRQAFYWISCCLNFERREELQWDRTPIAIFANDADRREFICAGAAAGIGVSLSFDN